MKGSLKLLEVLITWLQRFSSEIMGQKLIYGVQELFSTSYCVGFLHFGLVNKYLNKCSLSLSMGGQIRFGECAHAVCVHSRYPSRVLG